jgi:hypothetical protein
MNEILEKITRKELRRLKPGTWVAWRKTTWNAPDEKKFPFHEGQVIAHPVRSGQEVLVLLNGVPHATPKNRLYRLMPVIAIEDMHTEYDYNS